ncbi:MAG: MFS transporter, partial [Clostridiaceae bacterium]|nr:MFS transporter [Clostridiaceae bacterium]
SSRKAFIAEGAAALTITSLISGSYLAGFLDHIGVSETLNGILVALPTFVTISNPLGAIFSQRLTKQKPFVCGGALLHRIMFTVLFLLPLIKCSSSTYIIIAFCLIFFGKFIAGFISPSANNWIMSLAPRSIRGSFFGVKELVSLIMFSVTSLFVGFILDYYKARGAISNGFVVLGLIIGFLTLLNFFSLSRIMEPETAEERISGIKVTEALKMVIANKSFRPILIVGILYNFGIQIFTPYFGIYLVGDLKVSYTLISVVTFVVGIARAFAARQWGKFSDKTSWAYIFRFAVIILAVSHIIYSLLVESNVAWLYPLNSFFGTVGWAAIGIALFNVRYDFAPIKGRAIYLGFSDAFTGVLGFFGVFIGSLIMELTQNINMQISGFDIRPQQLLALLSGTMLLGCALYIKKQIEPVKGADNNSPQ